MSINDIIFPYIRLRQDFGRQPQFVEDHGRVHCKLKPNPNGRKLLMQKSGVDKGVQAIPPTKNTPMNSNRPVFKGWNYYHTEGGWAKEINVSEPEIIVRERKKLEKDEAFQNTMPILTENVEQLVKHNNSMHMYAPYYNENWTYPEDKKRHPFAHVVCDFVDPSMTERAVSNICWANNYGRMGVAYCPYDFDPDLRTKPTEAYFFEVEIPSRPEAMIKAPSHVTELHYHPKDPHSVIAAMYNGQVASWDNRVSAYPQTVSSLDVSHEDICTTATWINSKTGSEFMSGGLDGQILWWDERSLDKRLDEYYLDPEKGQCRKEFALGCSVIEYDHTLPTKFIAGTEKGNIMLMMKKGKTANERLVHCYKGHRGRVRSVHRNPSFIKNVLSCGLDCLRIYAEDCRESSIMWTAPIKCKYTYAHWIPTRPSVIVASRLDGRVDFWDLLKHPVYPFLSTRVSNEQLTCLWPSDNGKFIAVGTNKGKVRLLKPADYMTTFTKNDRPTLAAIFEREARREKFLEQRHREIRLRKRDKDKVVADKKKVDEDRQAQIQSAQQQEKETGTKIPLPDYSRGKDYDIKYEALHDPLLQTQRDFYNELDAELAAKGLDAFEDKRSKASLVDVAEPDEGEEEESLAASEPSSQFNMPPRAPPPQQPKLQPPPPPAFEDEEDTEEGEEDDEEETRPQPPPPPPVDPNPGDEEGEEEDEDDEEETRPQPPPPTPPVDPNPGDEEEEEGGIGEEGDEEDEE